MFLASKFLSSFRKSPIHLLYVLTPPPPHKTSLYNTSAYSYFWNILKKKSDNPSNPATKDPVVNQPDTSSDEETSDFSKEKNLGFLIQKIKEKNTKKKPLLPPKDKKYQDKKTLVLEMDETLLYTFFPDEHEAYLYAPDRKYDIYLDFPEHQTFLSIYLRDHLEEFLSYLQENFEPILFCNGVKEYVDKVMDIVDKDKVFVHRIYQDSCDRIIDHDENLNELTKDLQILNRDLSKTILIDSRAFNLWCYPDNCIPIKQYEGDSVEKDDELLNIMDILEDIKNLDDVRPFLREKYKISDLLHETNML